MCITAPPFFLMMSVGCARNTTHCASYETRVEEGWVHFISTRRKLRNVCEGPLIDNQQAFAPLARLCRFRSARSDASDDPDRAYEKAAPLGATPCSGTANLASWSMLNAHALM
jgi:hypothetical protein